MEREKVFEQVKTIIVDRLGVAEAKVTMDARFREDLEADSLDLVELLMDFDDKFGAKIEDEEAENIKTVGQAVDFLLEKLAAK